MTSANKMLAEWLVDEEVRTKQTLHFALSAVSKLDPLFLSSPDSGGSYSHVEKHLATAALYMMKSLQCGEEGVILSESWFQDVLQYWFSIMEQMQQSQRRKRESLKPRA
jgi:hypothetical protein